VQQGVRQFCNVPIEQLSGSSGAEESSRPAHGVQFILVRDAAGRELASTKPPNQEFGGLWSGFIDGEQARPHALNIYLGADHNAAVAPCQRLSVSSHGVQDGRRKCPLPF